MNSFRGFTLAGIFLLKLSMIGADQRTKILLAPIQSLPDLEYDWIRSVFFSWCHCYLAAHLFKGQSRILMLCYLYSVAPSADHEQNTTTKTKSVQCGWCWWFSTLSCWSHLCQKFDNHLDPYQCFLFVCLLVVSPEIILLYAMNQTKFVPVEFHLSCGGTCIMSGG